MERPCREIVVGGSFVCFVNDVTIEFWGKMGEINSITENYENVITIGEITGALACSDSHLLLLNNGQVYALGLGEEGQLGLGEDFISVNSFVRNEINHSAVQVLCNNEVSVAITREVIYVWGLVNPLQLNSAPRNS